MHCWAQTRLEASRAFHPARRPHLMQPSPNEIIRCLKHDLGGGLAAGADYADRIVAGARRNPSAEPGMAENHAEAARRLRAEIEINAALDPPVTHVPRFPISHYNAPR